VKDLRVADILPWAGGFVTLIVGHFLSRRRNSEQDRASAERRAVEREEERREVARQRLMDELERQRERTLFWRERAQSYRVEAYALRALIPAHIALPPQTPDTPDEDL
jgi:hypothetical protein